MHGEFARNSHPSMFPDVGFVNSGLELIFPVPLTPPSTSLQATIAMLPPSDAAISPPAQVAAYRSDPKTPKVTDTETE
jgi:hypothetical protein